MMLRLYGVTLLLGLGASMPLQRQTEPTLPQPFSLTQASAEVEADAAAEAKPMPIPQAQPPPQQPPGTITNYDPNDPSQPRIKMSKVGNPSNPSTMFEIDMPTAPDPNKELVRKLNKKCAEVKAVKNELKHERAKVAKMQEDIDN